MKFISENPIIFIFLTALMTIVFTYLIDIKFNRKNVEEKAEKQEELPKEEVVRTPTIPYSELKDILDTTINRELYFWLQLTVNMKDVKIIDFAETVETLSRRISGALSKNFMSDLSYYHDETWIMRYIVRTVKIYVTDYIRKHPIS